MKQQEMVIKINPTTMFWTFALVAFVVYLNATFTYLNTQKAVQSQIRILRIEAPMMQEFKNLKTETKAPELLILPHQHEYKKATTDKPEVTGKIKTVEKAGAAEQAKKNEVNKNKGTLSSTVARITKASNRDNTAKHFSEECYVLGAIVLHGEAGAIKSKTEQSGVLWTIWNRVLDEQYPNDIPSVITQEGQFDSYTINGVYTKADYDLAVDVFERAWREAHGESSESAGRTLPKDYLYFYGDGKHNYFVKYFGGEPYVWGSQFISPYEN